MSGGPSTLMRGVAACAERQSKRYATDFWAGTANDEYTDECRVARAPAAIARASHHKRRQRNRRPHRWYACCVHVRVPQLQKAASPANGRAICQAS
jgi:hypothetical protein